MPYMTDFAGQRIADYTPEEGLSSPERFCYRIAGDWEGPTILDQLEALASEPRIGELRAVSIGWWEEHEHGVTSLELRNALIERLAPAAPQLEALFWGDISYEENEISWIENCDIGPLLEAFQRLTHVGARGGSGLDLSSFGANPVRHLEIQTGGIDASMVRDIASQELAHLEHFEIWLGSSRYGFDGQVDDLSLALHGKAYPDLSYPMPKLKYLGLRNCELGDAICEQLDGAMVLRQVEVLDLSMGLVTDRGVQALLSIEDWGSLTTIDISSCWVGDADLLAQLEALPVSTITAAQRYQPDNQGWRRVEVSE